MKNPVIEYSETAIPLSLTSCTWYATAAVNGFDQAPVIAAGNPFAIFANMKIGLTIKFRDLDPDKIDTAELETTDWSLFSFDNIKVLTFGIGYEDHEIKITMRRTLFVGQ